MEAQQQQQEEEDEDAGAYEETEDLTRRPLPATPQDQYEEEANVYEVSFTLQALQVSVFS